jgi:transcription elongation factor Elf1
MRDYSTQRSHKRGRKIISKVKRNHTEWKKVFECYGCGRRKIQKMYEDVK